MSQHEITSPREGERPLILPRFTEGLQGEFHPRVYELLPPELRKVLQAVDNRHERDILLLGALTVLSGCMPNVRGLYDRRWISPNLYTFIEAPAGSGKGVLSWARLLGVGVHAELREESRIAREQYEERRKEMARKKDPEVSLLTEPAQRLLFIPVNNSASSMVQTLAENEGAGILFSTEADTLANSLAQDWGNFSDVLRCAFHHEPIDLQRRLNREYLTVDHPRLSVLLTGTRGQLLRLIPDPENGLFSRFMYYSFPASPVFRNVFARQGRDLGELFRSLGAVVVEMHRFLRDLEYPIAFSLHPESEQEFITLFSRYSQDSYEQVGTPLLATVHRLGLIGFRIAMVLTMFRYFTDPNRKELERISIRQVDFAIAMDLVEHFLFHATLLLAEMKDGSRQIAQHSRNMTLYQRLPEEFTRAMASEISKSMGISTSTLSRYLLSGNFERIGQGRYRKMLISAPPEQLSK
jgi:hypothetical protein